MRQLLLPVGQIPCALPGHVSAAIPIWYSETWEIVQQHINKCQKEMNKVLVFSFSSQLNTNNSILQQTIISTDAIVKVY